ncbi:Aste57867_5326 [Aphanomyces stellatus]|uniref:Aste57867_5326 protein n=1 Tax=Aphanomyces stellatus TaxID=120398 RepID=A0A485KCR9_9STRA|nr:hypothetical protein As57867_005313 [Aphanomyces stellatus]VFT82391.1 Aste57867_5326 [Aphanomyces stellatus]
MLGTQIALASTRDERITWWFAKAFPLIEKYKYADVEIEFDAALATYDKDNKSDQGFMYWRTVSWLALVKTRLRQSRTSWAPLFEAVLSHQELLHGVDHDHVIDTKLFYSQSLVGVRELELGGTLLDECFESTQRLYGDNHHMSITMRVSKCTARMKITRA